MVAFGRHGFYKDGGSKPRRKQYGDSHLVQWTALTDLMKDHGIIDYDFVGTPPKDRVKDKEHPFHGLGLFKTSFTKTVIDYTGVWDQQISPRRARLWNTVIEKVMRRLWVRSRNEAFY